MTLARALALASLGALGFVPTRVAAQQYDPALYSALRWRLIGPFHGGRTVAAAGVPGTPDALYIGVNNGGVWRSADYGRTWTPIFDDQPTGSIGAIAVAPSDPQTLYVGSGEGLQRPDLSVGDGIYKSTDGGRSWRHLGLRDGQQVPAILVDPRDPNRVFAAVLGHPYGPNEERGIYRSTDGGETWQKVLYKDENSGGMDLAFDPADPQTVFAVLWAARQAPWEIGSSWTLSASNGLYKSTDGGTTWRQITAGLPGAAEGLGRIGLAVAASNRARMYAVVGAGTGGGLYRSDDGGEGWRVVNADERLWGRDGDFNEVKVDPTNPDVVYAANVVAWKSTDGGRTFSAFRGAPGGDDYHRLWIDPRDPGIILLAGDQGAVVTVNGGATWSSWYNQPTAQFYHVATDRRFPYWVYGGQQESGSAGIVSRSNDGQITFREWHPVGAEEYGYVAPDPLHPDVVYGGKLSRFDWSTGQVQEVSPEPVRAGKHRWVRTMPLVFSPVDPRVLYFAANVLFRTVDGGATWQTISPDLTRATSAVPASLGAFAPLDPEQGKHRGVIYAIAPSVRKVGLLWVGTDDGLIHVTHDGGRRWADVTPAALTPWSKVSVIEASHFDTLTAYAAVNRFRLDDLRPHVYRTRDGGRTWSEGVAGLPSGAVVNAVREDPARRGPLYAGTELGVYVSFDDGDHWQSLQLNLPVTSVRDLVVHDSDLVVATHGRSFWILDDVAPLRHMSEAAAAAGRGAGALECKHRHAAADRRARRAKPARRRGARLLSRTHPGGADRARDPRRDGARGASLLERRCAAAARLRPEHPPVVDAAAGGARHGSGHAPLRVGSARAATRGAAPRVSHRRGAARHATRAARALGAARALRRPAHGGRTRLHATSHGAPRSPAAGPERRPGTAIRAGRARGGRAAPGLGGVGARGRTAARGPSARPQAGPAAPPDSLEQQAATLVSELTRLNGRLVDLYGMVEGADAAPTRAAEASGRQLERELSALEGRARALEDRFRSRGRGLQ